MKQEQKNVEQEVVAALGIGTKSAAALRRFGAVGGLIAKLTDHGYPETVSVGDTECLTP